MAAVPIWKDYFVTLGTSASGFQFRIKQSGTVIYQGKAYPRPGSTTVQVRINDICADYLTRNFALVNADYYDASFTVEAYIASSWTVKDTVQFFRDWSYDDTLDLSTHIPMAPIVPILHPQQYLPIWAYGGVYEYDLVFRVDDGDYNTDFNEDFDVYSTQTQHVAVDDYDFGEFLFLNLAPLTNLVEVVANGRTYRVGNLCGGYVLYYLNAYGSWDSLAVQGRTVKSAGIVHQNIDRVYSNRAYVARGTDNWLNEITPQFRFTIGPLTSDQAELMHHLLGSTYVYVHDLNTGRIHPVVLTATSMEDKNRPGVLHTYEVEARLAQDRMRR